MSNVLITGAAGGFGKLTVAALVKAGHKVAGTVRDANGRNKAAAAVCPRTMPLCPPSSPA